MSKILGIDLGTTNSAVAVVEGGEDFFRVRGPHEWAYRSRTGRFCHRKYPDLAGRGVYSRNCPFVPEGV